MQQGSLKHLSPVFKLILLITTILFCISISAILMSLIAKPVFGIDMTSLEKMQNNIAFMQSFQIIQSICLFVIPSLLAFYFYFSSFKSGISGEGSITAQSFIITIALVFLAQGFITYSGWLNHQIQLPESYQFILDWMAAKEKEASELTLSLIQTDNWHQILITVVMMSILPAIGEEWLFRGLIQRYLSESITNKHIAILITAIIFSAVHMQLLTFLPRFFLGIILGYIFAYSGNLWLAVLAHFVNNFMAIVAFMLMAGDTEATPFDIPTENPFGIGVLISLLTIIAGIYAIKYFRSGTPFKPNY